MHLRYHVTHIVLFISLKKFKQTPLFYFSTDHHLLEVLVKRAPCPLINCGYVSIRVRICIGVSITTVHSIGVSLRLPYCADIHGNHTAHGFLTIEVQLITINCSESIYGVSYHRRRRVNNSLRVHSALLVRHQRSYHHILVFELRFLSQV